MAMINIGDSLDNLDSFITLSEPACGAGPLWQDSCPSVNIGLQ